MRKRDEDEENTKQEDEDEEKKLKMKSKGKLSTESVGDMACEIHARKVGALHDFFRHQCVKG